MSKLRLVDAALDGFSQYEFTVSEDFSNLNDVMHGGAYGVVFGLVLLHQDCGHELTTISRYGNHFGVESPC